MAIQQPIGSDTLNSPSHSLSHRVFANDSEAPVKSVVVDSTGEVGIGTETPNSTLHTNGSVSYAYVAKTANYVLTASDYQIECTANSFTITLPTAVGITGRVYSIKNTGTGTITIDGDGTEEIDGETTQTILQWENITIISNGAGWLII